VARRSTEREYYIAAMMRSKVKSSGLKREGSKPRSLEKINTEGFAHQLALAPPARKASQPAAAIVSRPLSGGSDASNATSDLGMVN